jgi:CHASE3 domain sensor protein
MRIRRKIAYGYIILILLLLLILLYQYGLAQRMLTGIRRFSEVDFVASIELLRSYQGLDGLKEFVEKFLATGDDRYAVEIVQRMHDIDGDIEDLEQYDLEPEVRQELLTLKCSVLSSNMSSNLLSAMLGRSLIKQETQSRSVSTVRKL